MKEVETALNNIPLRLLDISSTAGAGSEVDCYLPKTAVHGVGIFSSIAGAFSRFGPRMKMMRPAKMGTRMTTIMLNGLSMKLGALRGCLCVC